MGKKVFVQKEKLKGLVGCLREHSSRIYDLSKGVLSLSKEEHGLFFDAMQRLGLSSEVKDAAVALYLDFRGRPVGKYNAERKNLDIFLIASISLAAKATGDLRTDQEFESKMFVSRERLTDAEERLLRSFGVQENVIPFSELVSQLAERQIQSMAESFAERELIPSDDKERLVGLCHDYLDAALEKGLSPKMSYRGRAAGAVLKAVRDLGLQISESDIARAAGFDKKSMATNADVIETLLKDASSLEKKER